MAMLLLNQIFERTWGSRAGQRPPTEYWDDVIPAIKNAHPNFPFIAEAYWDLEWELQQRGFDFCYDKRLYDRLEHDTQRVFDFISVLTLPTRRSCFASSRTTMSLGPQRLFHRQRSPCAGSVGRRTRGNLAPY